MHDLGKELIQGLVFLLQFELLGEFGYRQTLDVLAGSGEFVSRFQFGNSAGLGDNGAFAETRSFCYRMNIWPRRTELPQIDDHLWSDDLIWLLAMGLAVERICAEGIAERSGSIAHEVDSFRFGSCTSPRDLKTDQGFDR